MKRTKTIHNQLYSDLVEKLCLERKRLGLSQTEVADQLHMRQSEISKIESKERRIDALELSQLLKVYRVNENTKLKQLILDFLELDM
jgi:transcriptional regulator with XRE-family HTH domain